MERMRQSRFRSSRMTHLALWLVSGCVTDHTVENDVPAAPGLVQPEASGVGALGSAEACSRIGSARGATSAKLGCDMPAVDCPAYLFPAGSLPCDEYYAGSVEACEAVIAKYDTCADFSTKACVVTPIAGSCRKPVIPEAGSPARDSAVPSRDGEATSG